jgi:transposase InsO family protein
MIQNLATQYPIHTLCRVLDVSRSAYYQWRKRPLSRRAQANQHLLQQIQQAFVQSRQTYGSPRITHQLRRQQITCSKNRIVRLMRAARLQARSKRPFRPRTTDSRHDQGVAPNWCARCPAPAASNQIWVADITYIHTLTGWAYLAAVMDLHSRKIVGWAIGYSLQASLVQTALQQALTHRRPAAGLIHHSDRGVQYASNAFRSLLQSHQITPSMSATGYCYDNANMESFWSTLKCELIQNHSYHDLFQARSAIFEYIEVFYNRQRLHSAIGYHSPVEFEQIPSTSYP